MTGVAGRLFALSPQARRRLLSSYLRSSFQPKHDLILQFSPSIVWLNSQETLKSNESFVNGLWPDSDTSVASK